jgi:betaine-aldehyde dehydrogenase/5-carboxymethyl-2-hydroxymuconic-semialdehyde dehydrogenase
VSHRVEIHGHTVSPEHYIDGQRVGSSTTFEDRSPIDGSLLAEVCRGDAGTADAAIAAAVRAFPAWAALGPEGRAPYLHRLAELIDEHVDHIAEVECWDMAMLERSLKARVIGRGARNFRAYADLACAYEERVWESNGAPALAAGCTVVLKPAEWSPLSCSMLFDLVDNAGFPPGVFNLVQGIGEEVGVALTTDRRVRRLSFTGSPETARHIGRAGAENIVPFTAELGGKNPFIVFADADLDAAAAKAALQYDDAGQVCLSGTRLIVEESVVDDFLQRFNANVDAQVLGDPHDDATTISPLIHPDHLARVAGFVERARANGDEVLRGGKVSDLGGNWYEQTLIRPQSNDSEIVQHEVFGPVLTIQTFTTEEEAIALANSTEYGLSGILFTSDAERADRIGRTVRAGTFWVNCFLVRDLTAPFGGAGISGIGREGGDYALDFYSDLKTLQILEDSVS